MGKSSFESLDQKVESSASPSKRWETIELASPPASSRNNTTKAEEATGESRPSFEVLAEPFDTQHPLYPAEPPPAYTSSELSDRAPKPSNRKRRKMIVLGCALLCIAMFIAFIVGMSVTFAHRHAKQIDAVQSIVESSGTATATSQGPTRTSSGGVPTCTGRERCQKNGPPNTVPAPDPRLSTRTTSAPNPSKTNPNTGGPDD